MNELNCENLWEFFRIKGIADKHSHSHPITPCFMLECIKALCMGLLSTWDTFLLQILVICKLCADHFGWFWLCVW